MSTRRRELLVCGVFLLVVGVTAGRAWWDISAKRALLDQNASEIKKKLDADAKGEAIESVMLVESGKTNVFFGADWGVVRVYMCKSNDSAMDSFVGLEYFMRFEGERWQEKDTARIELPADIYEGYRVLEMHGHQVEKKAYERYNR